MNRLLTWLQDSWLGTLWLVLTGWREFAAEEREAMAEDAEARERAAWERERERTRKDGADILRTVV